MGQQESAEEAQMKEQFGLSQEEMNEVKHWQQVSGETKDVLADRHSSSHSTHRQTLCH